MIIPSHMSCCVLQVEYGDKRASLDLNKKAGVIIPTCMSLDVIIESVQKLSKISLHRLSLDFLQGCNVRTMYIYIYVCMYQFIWPTIAYKGQTGVFYKCASLDFKEKREGGIGAEGAAPPPQSRMTIPILTCNSVDILARIM